MCCVPVLLDLYRSTQHNTLHALQVGTLCSHSLPHPHTSPQHLTHQCFTPSNHLTHTLHSHPSLTPSSHTSPSLLIPSHITLTPHSLTLHLDTSRINASLHLTISPLHAHTFHRHSSSPHTSLPTPHTSPPLLTMRESHVLLCDVLQFVPAPPLDPGEGVSHPQHWVTPLGAKGNSIALYREGGRGKKGGRGSRRMMVIKRRIQLPTLRIGLLFKRTL